MIATRTSNRISSISIGLTNLGGITRAALARVRNALAVASTAYSTTLTSCTTTANSRTVPITTRTNPARIVTSASFSRAFYNSFGLELAGLGKEDNAREAYEKNKQGNEIIWQGMFIGHRRYRN